MIAPYRCNGLRLVAAMEVLEDRMRGVYVEGMCANNPRTLHGQGQDTATVSQRRWGKLDLKS